jgi:hypothetical protein
MRNADPVYGKAKAIETCFGGDHPRGSNPFDGLRNRQWYMPRTKNCRTSHSKARLSAPRRACLFGSGILSDTPIIVALLRVADLVRSSALVIFSEAAPCGAIVQSNQSSGFDRGLLAGTFYARDRALAGFAFLQAEDLDLLPTSRLSKASARSAIT